jgi:hypothetical protein
MTDTERLDLPSASSAARYAACPGSYLLSLGLENLQTPEMKAMAEAGDRIHLWLEAPDFITLEDPNELETAEACSAQRDLLIAKIFGENAPHVKKIKEDRHWITQGKKRVFSAKADDISIYGDTGLIIDFKSGRGDTEESPKNLQLRSQMVTVFLNHGQNLRKIYVAIVQPLVSRDPLVCCYEGDDIISATQELSLMLIAINNPATARVAGDQCKFCPAKFKCPESKAYLETLAAALPEAADMERLAELLNVCAACDPIIKAIRARAKLLLKQDPSVIPGWTLGKPASVRSISDPFAVFKVLSDAKPPLITREQFLTDCVSVGVGDLEKAVAKHNGLKPAQAKETVNSVCADFIEVKPKEPSLEKL